MKYESYSETQTTSWTVDEQANYSARIGLEVERKIPIISRHENSLQVGIPALSLD